MKLSNLSTNKIRLPTKATLRKYGLSQDDFVHLWERQQGQCPICHRLFDEKVRAVIDHLHAPRWKKMPPDKRKRYVRGLLCLYDNRRMLPKGMTLQRARNIVLYLEKFESTLPDKPSRPFPIKVQSERTTVSPPLKTQ